MFYTYFGSKPLFWVKIDLYLVIFCKKSVLYSQSDYGMILVFY